MNKPGQVAGALLAGALVVVSQIGTAPPSLAPVRLAASAAATSSYPTALPGVARIVATPSQRGFFVLSREGEVHGYGDAVALGNAALPHPAVALAVTRTGHGYWVFDANGCTQAFGDAARFSGTVCGTALNGPILDAAATPSGNGYWLVANDGGIFSFGDAPFAGSMGGRRLNAPIVGMAPSTTAPGYWEVAADGGIFAFGVPFLGSMGGQPLNRPVVGMVASGSGYLMVGADGGIFNFGNPYFGSLGANPPATAVVATAPSVDGTGHANGYWMLDGAGVVYGFGSAWMPAGSAAPPGHPVVSPTSAPAFADDAPDPDIVRSGSTWYMFTTGTTWGNHIGVLTSTDPASGWHTINNLSYGSTAIGPLPAWEQDNTQTSPGVYAWGGRYVMFYDAIDRANGLYCLSVATSPSLGTPFTDNSSGPLECQTTLGGSIDPSPFVDVDGTPWLLWKSNDGSSSSVSDVWAVPLAADGATPAGAPRFVMAKDSSAHPWETTVDDPQMVVVGGTRYLFFTGGDWQSAAYAVGYAVCSSVTGPCTQPQAGPILASYGPAAGPGGGSVAQDAAGNWWLAYAAWSPGCTNYGCGGRRQLYVAPLSFN